MVSESNALFVTARYRSLGETYTLARFAGGLRAAGWRVDFLAFEFAAAFLREQQMPVTLLGDDRRENRVVFDRLVAERPPQVVFTTDYFLLCFKETADVWSNRWLFDLGCPVASFDHLMLHPAKRSLSMALHKRLEQLSPPLLAKVLQVHAPPGAVLTKPRHRVRQSSDCEIEALPDEVVAFIRSCPVHDPRPEPDPRAFRFSAAAGEVSDGTSRASIRARLGIAEDERLVLVPVGSWALQMCRAYDVPYYEYYPRLIVRYLRDFPGPVRIVFISSELDARRESHGRVEVDVRSALPLDVVSDLTRAADLVLTDNKTSSSLGRAVMSGVPAAAFFSSVAPAGPPAEFAAPFELSNCVRGILAEMEARAPASVFPFDVFPMGWREEMASLFAGNRYAGTFEALELFDEVGSRKALHALLGDDECREALRARQAAYRAAVERLPGAPAITTAILAKAEVASCR